MFIFIAGVIDIHADVDADVDADEDEDYYSINHWTSVKPSYQWSIIVHFLILTLQHFFPNKQG